MVSEHRPNDLVALSTAAAAAYLALARRGLPQAQGLLDVAAIALAACIPIYGARHGAEPLRRLTDADVAGGKFTHGASRLQFGDGRSAFTRLAVTAADFAKGLERLKRAGVNFAHARHDAAPRRLPTVMPPPA